MSDLVQAIKGEITRLSRKEIKKVQVALKAELSKLRKEVSTLRGAVSELKKENKALRSLKVSAGKVAPESADKNEKPGIRPTVKSVKRLRAKLGLGQDDFATLCGVGRITVSRWEQGDGRVVFRGVATAKRFAEVMEMGKAQAIKELEAIKGEPVAAGAAPKKRGRKLAVKKEPNAVVKKERKQKSRKAAKPGRPAKKAGAKTKAAVKPTAERIGKVSRRLK